MTGQGFVRTGPPWVRRDWLILGSLFALTFLSRIPFRTSLLYAWDSVLYTRALDSFNVAMGLPQPPGHIFYVGLIWLANSLLNEPNSAMVWTSIFFAAAAVAALFWLGRLMFDRGMGILAALLLATSISFWAYSEVAYPYTLLGFLSIIVAGAVYRLWQGSAAWALPAALILGIASGFREDLFLFMLPLLAVGMWSRGAWRILGAAGILAVSAASWYVPSAMLSGGLGPYRQVSNAQTSYLLRYFSVFGHGPEALISNSTTLGRFLLLGLAAAAPLLAIFFFLLFLPVPPPLKGEGRGEGDFNRPHLRDRRLLFLLVWSAPSLLFYVFIHVGEYGYVFTFLPAALLAGAWGLKSLAQTVHRREAGGKAVRVFALAAAAPVFINVLFFLAVPTPLSAGRIAARDDILGCRLRAIRDNFDPESTFIVSVYDYQQAAYYLPDFHHWHFDPAVVEQPSTGLPPGIEKVVIFEEDLIPQNLDRAKSRQICGDQQLFFIDAAGDRTIVVDWEKGEVSLDA